MTDYTKYFIWLYSPNEEINIDQLIHFAKLFQIPYKIIFNKYVILMNHLGKSVPEIKTELLKYYDTIDDDIFLEIESVNVLTDEIKNKNIKNCQTIN